MKVYEKNGQRFVELKGKEYPFDEVLAIFVDADSGSWVISTSFTHEFIIHLLEDVIEHCLEAATDPHPDIDIKLFPPPTDDWN
jgi:hypothetical protein